MSTTTMTATKVTVTVITVIAMTTAMNMAMSTSFLIIITIITTLTMIQKRRGWWQTMYWRRVDMPKQALQRVAPVTMTELMRLESLSLAMHQASRFLAKSARHLKNVLVSVVPTYPMQLSKLPPLLLKRSRPQSVFGKSTRSMLGIVTRALDGIATPVWLASTLSWLRPLTLASANRLTTLAWQQASFSSRRCKVG